MGQRLTSMYTQLSTKVAPSCFENLNNPIVTVYMKRVLILCFAIFVSGCGKESKTVQSSSDSSSVQPEGIKIEYPDTPGLVRIEQRNAADKLVSVGYLLNGKKEGSWVTYGLTGLIMTVTTYVNDKKEGLFIEFNYSNQMVKRFFYHNDQLHGEYREFKDSKPKELKYYENGIQDGVARLFYEDGKIMEESYYKKGLRDGRARWFDKEGRLTIEYEYKKGELVK